jgi:hypothetical protein
MIDVIRPRYRIMAERYNKEFDVENVLLHSGAILSQMMNLFDGLAERQQKSRNIIRYYLLDKEGNEIATT